MDIKDTKIVFMGTPEISAKVLRGLILAGYNIVGLIAQPDRPVGRKKILESVPSKKVAEEFNITVYQKEKIRKDYEFLKEIKPDLIITLAYGQIIPQEMLDIPSLGCVNLHGSLLPKYRGAAPIQYALINNEKVTGMTLMRMVKEMDAGEIYDKEIVQINIDDNATSLFEKMADAALRLILRDLPLLIEGKLKGEAQDESLVSFSPSIKVEEEKLDLNKNKEQLFGYIRALSDNPGAYLYLDNEKFKIYKSSIVSDEIIGQIGEIVKADKNGLYLQCTNGVLNLLEVQKEGKKRMDFRSFINGNQGILGKKLS